MIWCVWVFTFTNKKYVILPPISLDMTCARFMASMFMHINVQKDVLWGIRMMKYAINHRDRFTNVYAAFLFGFLSTVICICVEFNVILILSSVEDITSIIMKYVTLSAIANIPRFYFASLHGENKLNKVNGLKLKIEKRRNENPWKDMPCMIRVMKVIQKIFRLFYAT